MTYDHEKAQADKRAVDAKLVEVATAVAASLPGSWKIDCRDPAAWNADLWIELVGANDARLVINTSWAKGRYCIWGQMPKSAQGLGLDLPRMKTITVSRDKSPEKIARDIERRVLPLYLPALADVKKRVAVQNEYIENKMATALDMALAFGDDRYAERVDRHHGSVGSVPTICGKHARAEVRTDKSVEIEITTTPEVAVKIAKLLAKEMKP